MLRYDTILLGATFYSAGYAARSKGKCLVIDRRGVVGSDFCACLKSNVPCDTEVDLVSDFRKKLSELGIIASNGRIHIVPCAMELARFYLEKDIDILLETEVMSVEKKEKGFLIRIFNRDGLSEIEADKIIDTEGRYVGKVKRTLGAMIVAGTVEPKIPEEIGHIMRERYDSELLFHIVLDEKDDMATAREKMRDVVEKTELLGDWQIASVSSDFAWHYDGKTKTTLENGVFSIPSSSFGDIISAMEGGARDASAMA